MSWGDSFISGFRASSEIRDRKKQREADERRDAALRDLQLELDARRTAAAKDLQTGDQIFRRGESQADRDFRSGESDKERGFRTSERLGTQGFQSGEADKERGFRTSERLGTQGFQASQSDLDRAARSLALDKELATRGAALDWQRSPENPANAYYKALAARMPGPDSMGLGATLPKFGQDAEGREVIGPGGKRYIIKNGVPVPVQ